MLEILKEIVQLALIPSIEALNIEKAVNASNLN
jgi:hypothetical protein